MHVLLNTDHNIEGRETLAAMVEGVVVAALAHFSRQITRVEVHLSDEHGDKRGPQDKKCVMEARLEGHQPTAVTHHAPTVDEAVDGAAGKLQRSLESTLGRLHRT